MRPRYWVLAALPVIVGIVAALAWEPLVRSKAIAAAEARGFSVRIERVRLGWGRVWLEGVDVSAPRAPAVQGRVQVLEVKLEGLTPSQLIAHGGEVTLKGPPNEVRRQLRELRGAPGAGEPSSSEGRYAAEGLTVRWRDGDQELVAWGVRYHRDSSHHLAGDLVQAGGRLPLRLRGFEVQVQEGRLRRFTAAGLWAEVALDGDGLAPAGAGPAEPNAAEPEQGASLQAGSAQGSGATQAPKDAKAVLAQPKDSKSAPAGGLAVKQGSPKAPSDVAPGRGERWRRELARAATLISAQLPVEAEVQIAGFEVALVRGGEPLRIGPGSLSLSRTERELRVRLLPGAEANASPLTLDLTLPLDPIADVAVSVTGGPVSLAWLGVRDGEWGLTEVARAGVKARLELGLREAGAELSFKGQLDLTGVALERPWLAARPVRGVQLGLNGSGALKTDGSLLRVDEGELTVGEARATLRGELRRGDGHYQVKAKGSVPLAGCQALLDALPEGLAPLLEGMRADGTFAAEGSLELDSKQPERMQVSWNVANDCRITAASADVMPTRFKQPFTLMVTNATGAAVPYQTGPGTPNWVPRGSISRHLETAVLICEDGRFWRHRGFDEEAIRNSIRENVRQGRFVRGASTISMQLAKNLYLRREKTLSRKLQEAALTMLLEQQLTKHELLELYFNVIEYAPGIYGIAQGAPHYFNTHASQLSLGQALYMGSVLSSPKRQHFGPSGRVTDGWLGYLRRLMRLGNRIRLVSDADLEDGLREQVTFKLAYSPRLPAEGEDPDAIHDQAVDSSPFGGPILTPEE
ncbi:MAG: transglycosylase domain-containing protein [Polyangiaceae bacterium]|nr:transglycosylase domain-containing protein [Polyangiaceae bacterium]MCW5789808.1 transglycosylase domain-containing protein [Polyangiaceae bacterium]